MDVREKLVELLNKANSACVGTDCFEGCKFYMENDCLYKLMADVMIENGVTVQEWISVNDRLPENICPVLVALEGLNIAFHGWYQDEKWWKVGAGSRPYTQKVTHWMPLPQPPKGE